MSAYSKCAEPRLLNLSAILLAAAASSGMLGCADGSSPTSSPSQPQAYLVFSPQATPRTAKPAAAGNTVSQTIGPEGGELVARGEVNAYLKAKLSIPEHALAEAVPLTMSVWGSRLSELTVGFQPEGLVFLQTARLELKLDAELADLPLAELKAYHQYADGTTEEATLLCAERSGDGLVHLAIAIPGFSTYGLRSSP